MSQFDEIRPYNDDEIRPVINQLINDNECVDAIIHLALPTLGKWISPIARTFARSKLRAKTADVKTVTDCQNVMKKYLGREIDRTIDHLSVGGLDKLDKSAAYLFISNHRDIVMDPALVNWTIAERDHTTLRVAIGDNLLTKPFASHLMRMNKSFIVKRSATSPREKFKAAKLLSQYIHLSVTDDNENVWIAQREGRAKDGIDVSNQAIISMLALSKPKPKAFSEFLKELRIVPVTISYEYDPCDQAKARELYAIEKNGSYIKGEQEDVQSIATGITGFKGNVHVQFGEINGDTSENPEQMTQYLDKVMLENYILHPSNCIAYEMLEKKTPKLPVGESHSAFDASDFDFQRKQFQQRVDNIPAELRETFLRGYANVVYRKLQHKVS